jgi:hypothetical protein
LLFQAGNSVGESHAGFSFGPQILAHPPDIERLNRINDVHISIRYALSDN